MALYLNVHKNSLSFLRGAQIQPDSRQHKELKTTIQVLYPKYLERAKYLEEQSPDQVDKLIENVKATLPWLTKYENCWPARVYLKRYVDMKRPNLKRTKHRKPKSQKSEEPRDNNNMLDGEHVVKEFLNSLSPSLELHLCAFIQLGVRDRKTLEAFLSWPQETREQLLDEGRGVLQLTVLEKRGLLLGCALFSQRVLRGSLVL